MRHINHHLNTFESSKNTYSSSYWAYNIIKNSDDIILKNLVSDTKYYRNIVKSRSRLFNHKLFSKGNTIINTKKHITDSWDKEKKSNFINRLESAWKWYEFIKLKKPINYDDLDVIKKPLSERDIFSAKLRKARAELDTNSNYPRFYTYEYRLEHAINKIERDLIESRYGPHKKSQKRIHSKTSYLEKNYWYLKLSHRKYFVLNFKSTYKNVKPNLIHFPTIPWYNNINIKFLKHGGRLYTKLKYSRTPAYDIVSGGSAALLAALFGFLITEKFGFEMLDSGDFYYLFMYGVFFALVLKSFASSIEPSNGWLNHLNPKHLVNHISMIIEWFFKLFK